MQLTSLSATEILTRLGWEKVENRSLTPDYLVPLRFKWDAESHKYLDRCHSVNLYVLALCKDYNIRGGSISITLGTRDEEIVQKRWSRI